MSTESASFHEALDNIPTSVVPNRRISLQVGERHFTTLASTLSEGSTFFEALLSKRWADSQSHNDSYFVDADPDLFAHLLRYLRRGVLPIMYNKSTGFDHAFYRALQKEAGYFGIDVLHDWIEKKEYLGAVTIQYLVEELKGDRARTGNYGATVGGNTERVYYPSWRTEKVYRCPRGIAGHMGDPGACGKVCARATTGDDYVDQDVLRTLIVTKTFVFKDMD